MHSYMDYKTWLLADQPDEDTRDVRRLKCKSSRDPRARGSRVNARRFMSLAPLPPSRDDNARKIELPSRQIPIGFAAYSQQLSTQQDYNFYTLASWNVAIPRNVSGCAVSALLNRIYNYGPASAGYVAIGDSLVPASLGPGNRASLAASAVYPSIAAP